MIAVALLINPPYTVSDGGTSGKPQGFIPDLFQAIKIPGVTWDFQVLPWARMLVNTQMDKTGTMILPTLTRTAAREAQFTWIAKINSPHYYFLQKKPTGAAADLQSLRTKSVVVLLNNLEDTWLHDNGFTNIQEVSSINQMVQMVETGRADLLLKDMTSLDSFVKSQGQPPGVLSVAAEVKELNQPLYIAGSLSFSRRLADSIRRQMDSLQANGTLQKIWQRWQ